MDTVEPIVELTVAEELAKLGQEVTMKAMYSGEFDNMTIHDFRELLQEKIVREFNESLAKHQVELEPEVAKILYDNLWELYAR